MPDNSEIRRFENDMKSEELKKKLEDVTKRIAESGAVANDGELICAAAAELGYEFSVAELERHIAAVQELDEDELDKIAGGRSNYDENDSTPTIPDDEYGHDTVCLAAWHCYTAMLHTESESRDAACWSDFGCYILHHTEWVCPMCQAF